MNSAALIETLDDVETMAPQVNLLSWHDQLARVSRLSRRELQVFLLLGAGMSNRQMSQRLSVTERTVKAHVAQIMSKLKVESRLQAGLASFSFQVLWGRRRHHADRVSRRSGAGGPVP